MELKAGLVFAALFIVFAFVTSCVQNYYGNGGINLMSQAVDVTNEDPFILNLLQGNWQIDNRLIIRAILIAVSSNNVFKMVLGTYFMAHNYRLTILISFGSLIIAGFVMAFLF